jgi:phosphoglycolate phosphatase
MKYNTVLFDLDGTLIDTLEDLTDSVNLVMDQEGYPAKTIEEVKNGIGEGYRLLMEACLPKGSGSPEIDRCTALFETAYIERMMNKTKPYKGIIDLLVNLRIHGAWIAVVSNKMDAAAKSVCRHYFGALIDVAIGDTAERRKKPAPDNVLEALRQLDAEPEQALYVGDSDIDVRTAIDSGLDFIGVSWGYRPREQLYGEGAELVVDRPADVLAYYLDHNERQQHDLS